MKEKELNQIVAGCERMTNRDIEFMRNDYYKDLKEIDKNKVRELTLTEIKWLSNYELETFHQTTY